MLMAVREKLDELLRSQVVGAGGEISNDGPRTLELVASLLREEGNFHLLSNDNARGAY